MPSQFLDLDPPEVEVPAGTTIEQLKADIQSARGRGDWQAVLRGMDMLLKLSGAYEVDQHDARTDMPDAAVAMALAGWLLPPILGLLAGTQRPTAEQVQAAILAALTPDAAFN